VNVLAEVMVPGQQSTDAICKPFSNHIEHCPPVGGGYLRQFADF
jgi:hypothetical protein